MEDSCSAAEAAAEAAVTDHNNNTDDETNNEFSSNSAKRLKTTTSDETSSYAAAAVAVESSTTTTTTKTTSMDQSVEAMEEILQYKFKNKSLLAEALTHSSWSYSPSYERLEFVGDSILCVAFSTFVYLAYPNVEPGHLSRIRAANISTEKLARLAIRHGFHRHIRINAPAVEANIEEFRLKVQHDSNAVTYGGRIRAPKLLADIFESIAAAVFIDCDYDLKQFWLVFRRVLEPIAMLEDLKHQPQPVSVLYELCQKQGKQVEFKFLKNDMKKNVASVFVDGEFVASGYSCQKDSAKIDAAKEAVMKLSENENGVRIANGIPLLMGEIGEIKEAKQKLNQFCERKRLTKPVYKVVKETGQSHEKRFVCSVKIDIVSSAVVGEEKTKVKDAENSAASLMLATVQDII